MNLDLKNLHEYEYLITDYSGALEFGYLTGRSILFLDVKKKIKRKIGKEEKNYFFIENEMRTILGGIAKVDELTRMICFEIDDNEYSQFIDLINTHSNSLEKIINFLNKLD